MRLLSLAPKFFGTLGGLSDRDGNPVKMRTGLGISFNCPCGCDSRCAIPFSNPIDGGPSTTTHAGGGWQRTGETFDDLTLEPSIHRVGGCPKSWHGWIRNGEVITC
jgi:hypothetical protein